LDLGADLAQLGDVARGRVAARVAGVEPVDVGQQHQRIGADHLRDARAEPVVVAEANLRGRHRVVFVDDGHRAEREQCLERGARVEMAAALLGVLGREENLCDRDAVLRQRLLIGMGEPDLTRSGGGLFFLELERAADQAELQAACGDGAGRDDQHLLPPRAAPHHVLGQRVEPGLFDLAGVLDQEGRADFDDQPAGGCERLGHDAASFSAGVAAPRASFTTSNRRDIASVTPWPVAPDRVSTSPLLARFSAARFLVRSAAGTASLLLRPMISRLSARPWPYLSSSRRTVRQLATTLSSVASIRWKIAAQRSRWPRKRWPRPAPSLAPSIRPGRSAMTNSSPCTPMTPSCGFSVVKG